MVDAGFVALVIVASALTPALPVRYIAGAYFDAARDAWLLLFAWVGAAFVATASPALGLASFAVLLRWRTWRELPAVATWAAIVGVWFLARAGGASLRELLPVGWRVVALWLVAFAVVQRWRGDEIKATVGSRILLAMLLVLVWPFASPWEWPAYAVGFWLTSSWIALGALGVAVVARYPFTWPYVLGVVALVVALWRVGPTRRALLDRTPRGSSLDGFRQRWRTWRAMIRLTNRHPWLWLAGWGAAPADRAGAAPSLERALALEAVRLSAEPGEDRPLASSPTHCEPLEYALTYGACAVGAMLFLAVDLWRYFAPGDPWSASALAGVALSLATIPARAAPVGGVWLITLSLATAPR